MSAGVCLADPNIDALPAFAVAPAFPAVLLTASCVAVSHDAKKNNAPTTKINPVSYTHLTLPTSG